MADGIELVKLDKGPFSLDSGQGFRIPPGNYIAYPADVARARERALESARKVMKHRYDVFTSQAALMDELFSALADLDAAEGGAR